MLTRMVAGLNRLWTNLPLRVRAVALLLVPLPLLVVSSMALWRAARGEQQARDWVQHTVEVRSSIQDILVRLLDAEASVREFLLRGDGTVLRPYLESRELLPALSARLADLVQDDALQSERAKEVRGLIRNELDLLSGWCANTKASQRGASEQSGRVVLMDDAQDAPQRLRVKLTAMQMEEDRLLQVCSQNAESARLRVFAVVVEIIVAGLFFQMIVTLALAGTISRQIRALDTNARLVCEGLPTKPVALDTREMHELGARLQYAATLLADRECELHKTEEQFRTLFKEAPIAYHESDRQGVICHVNNAECALLGVAREDLLGKYVWNTAGPESQEAVKRNVMKRLAEKQPTTPYECEYECSDHSAVTVEVHENLVRDERGQVIGIRSALLDVTARKMVDMASRKVGQYAHELKTKNEELLLALKVAREANATKGRFLAAMSHELRTPLNGIIGLAELMYDGVVGAVTDEHKEYLGDILDSSRHLLRLVNDVLDLAKVESGKVEFRLEPVAIAPLLREVHDVLRIIADKKKIAFTLEIGPELKTVVTDGARLKQVAYNYLSNAIKFTPENGRIQVRATREAPASFRLEVEDTGPGIHASDIPQLFADFRQLEVTPNQGTGLGLALTKRIVEALGGSVGVRSTLGSGSVFYAVLPSLEEAEMRGPSSARGDGDLPAADTAAVFSRIPIRPEVPQPS